MDLPRAAGALRPGIRVMILDDDETGKTALAALRLGACEYVRKPVSLQFLLMQIEQQVLMNHTGRVDRLSEEKPPQALPTMTNGALPSAVEKIPNRNRRIRRKEFAQLNYLLQTLHT